MIVTWTRLLSSLLELYLKYLSVFSSNCRSSIEFVWWCGTMRETIYGLIVPRAWRVIYRFYNRLDENKPIKSLLGSLNLFYALGTECWVGVKSLASNLVGLTGPTTSCCSYEPGPGKLLLLPSATRIYYLRKFVLTYDPLAWSFHS